MKRTHIAALLAGLAAAPTWAAQYQLMIYESPAELAKRTDAGPAGQAYWQGFAAYGEALQRGGVLRGGAAVQSSQDARSVQARSGQVTIGAVPTTAGRPDFGGWFVIEVDKPEDAYAWAAKAPSAVTGGSVEVRPLYPVPGMMSR